jgi:N-acetylmuramoyl-L-alanine amidase
MNMIQAPCPHFNDRALPIDSIIIHYTDMPRVEETLAWFANHKSQVSCHYLICEKGQIYQLVDDEKRAWHAGESYWQGCTDINSCSLGIELANPGHSHGYIPFPEAQIKSLIELCHSLVNTWTISPTRILGHSDIAPRRKQDPGHLFPWDVLAREGLGLWPLAKGERHCEELKATKQSSLNVTEALSQIGYETVSPPHTIMAFQRHFQPHKIDGIPDEETYRLIQGIRAES